MKTIKNVLKTRSLYNGKIQIEFKEGGHIYKANGERIRISSTGVTGLLDKPALKFWAVGLMKTDLLEYISEEDEISVDQLTKRIEEASKLFMKKADKEASIGSVVHNYAEDFADHQLGIRDKKPVMPKDTRAKNGVIAFLNWVDEHQVKFIASELLVYSKKYKYVGLMDSKFTMGTEKHKIIHGGDYKTGNPELKKVFDPTVKRWSEVLRPRMEHGFQVSAYVQADIEESGETYGNSWIKYFSKDTGEFHAFELKDHKKDFECFRGMLGVKNRILELDEKKLLLSMI